MEQPVIGTPRERILAAIAYLLLWVTGLLVLLTAKPHERTARWHAVQAVALGVIVVALMMVLDLVSATLLMVALAQGGAGAVTWNPFWVYPWLSMGHLALAAGLVVAIVAAGRVRRGKTWRLPLLASIADRFVRPVAATEPLEQTTA